MKENKEKARKQFEERKGEKKSEFHQPLLIEDHVGCRGGCFTDWPSHTFLNHTCILLCQGERNSD